MRSNASQKVRHRNAELADAHHRDVAHLVVARGGIDAEYEGDDRREHHRHDRKRNGDGEPRLDQLDHRRRIGVTDPEPQAEEIAEPGEVAFEDGPVETKLFAQRLNRAFRRLDAEDHRRGIPRQDFQREKGQHRGAEQGRDESQKAFGEKDAHGALGREGRSAQCGIDGPGVERRPSSRPPGAGGAGRPAQDAGVVGLDDDAACCLLPLLQGENRGGALWCLRLLATTPGGRRCGVRGQCRVSLRRRLFWVCASRRRRGCSGRRR